MVSGTFSDNLRGWRVKLRMRSRCRADVVLLVSWRPRRCNLQRFVGMVQITHKNGDDLGMVYEIGFTTLLDYPCMNSDSQRCPSHFEACSESVAESNPGMLVQVCLGTPYDSWPRNWARNHVGTFKSWGLEGSPIFHDNLGAGNHRKRVSSPSSPHAVSYGKGASSDLCFFLGLEFDPEQNSECSPSLKLVCSIYTSI